MASVKHIILAALTASVTAQLPAPPVSWQNARGAVVRDRLYIVGGIIGYNTQFQGQDVYLTDETGWSSLNFSTPFNQNTSWAAVFQSNNISADPLAKPLVSGFMFADSNEWYTVG